MKDIRIAVIGVGRIGLTHAESLARRVAGVRLVTVTTSKPSRATAAREHWRGGRLPDTIHPPTLIDAGRDKKRKKELSNAKDTSA